MTDAHLKDEVMAAISRLHAGERATARSDLLELWSRIGWKGDPYLRSTVAHFIADTEDDPEAELAWDLKALAAATVDSERGDYSPVSASVAPFLPSLHLNVGDAYRRTGNIEQSRRHADAGRASMDVLNDDGYGAIIRAGLERLDERLRRAGA